MISFFRKLRNGEIKMGITRKYLLYGLGEIILVVIGILIALQINNWNENQKNNALALKYLSNVQTDLAQDTTVFSNTLIEIEGMAEFKKWALQQQSFDFLDPQYLEAITSSKYFNIQTNDQAFNKMNDPNVLNIAEFDSLYRQINIYYTFNQDYLNSFNSWDTESSMIETNYWIRQGKFEVSTFISPQDSIPVFQNEELRKKQLITMLESVEGRNQIKLSLFRIQTIKSIYERQLAAAKSVLANIDATLTSQSR